MNIQTIEQQYEFRISWIVEALLSNNDKRTSDFKSQDELDAFVWEHRSQLGELLYMDMGKWSDDWKLDFLGNQ